MIKLWSEVPGERTKELVADIATLVWVVFWGRAAWQAYDAISGFAEAGRLVNESGTNLTQAGVDLGGSLEGVPVIGPGVADLARGALAGAGQPLVAFGSEIESFVITVAFALALLIALVAIGPWLLRYLPWRWRRLVQVRAAHRVIRRAADLPEAEIQQLLAMRALVRIDYQTLLEHTPDPLGDWANGRHDRLARAELATVGLRPD
jgi:hypothetical protein